MGTENRRIPNAAILAALYLLTILVVGFVAWAGDTLSRAPSLPINTALIWMLIAFAAAYVIWFKKAIIWATGHRGRVA